VAVSMVFPKAEPQFSGSYGSLMRSLVTLIKKEPLLREASLINALTFSSFGMFWTTMVLYLSNAPFHFQSDQIGLFGLAAVAGALIAPLIGGTADKGNPRVTIGYGLLIVGSAFICFYTFGTTVTGMVIGIILLDLGQQSVHVSNQARVYALQPAARNRLNTVFMTVSFIGTSLGSAIGLWAWDRAQWTGICAAGAVSVTLALIVYGVTYKGNSMVIARTPE
jgi:predicted MFS family arabinose efflux permease